MSEIQKCPNLVRGGGVNIFQKFPKFKNVPNVGRGGGNPNWDIVPNFLDFLFSRIPYVCMFFPPIPPPSQVLVSFALTTSFKTSLLSLLYFSVFFLDLN